MAGNYRIYFALFILLSIFTSSELFSQDINIKIGYRDIINSEILNENRQILIHLPDNYNNSDKLYPVLYRLDGDADLLLETISITSRLTYSDEIAPELIIVAINNTNRERDMWPVNTMYYPETETPGANDFLNFIEKELIPYIDGNYKTTQERIIVGQSLSGIFTLYTFLTKPQLFDSYVICSGAFPDCEKYFKELSLKVFQNPNQFNGRKVFITNGLNDPLDEGGWMNPQMINFSNLINEKLRNNVKFRYLTYENEGHVPFHSLYDGLKFIFESSVKNQ